MLTLAALVSASGVARAEGAEAKPEASLAPVEVVGKRSPDPAVMPAKFIYKIDRIAQKHGNETVRLDFKVVGKNGGRPARGTKIEIEFDDGSEEVLDVGLDAKGLVRLPPLSVERSEHAKLITNQPKGSMGVGLELDVLAKPATLSPAVLQKTDQTLRAMVTDFKGLLPWAFRWLIPDVSGVALCQPIGEPPGHWQWANGSSRLLYLYETDQFGDEDEAAEAGDKKAAKVEKPKSQCAILSARGLPEDARLQVPASAKLGPWINGLTGRKSRS
ncbi:hypothetical protein RQP53_03285 [Paucibacter sp. APW11]|uniref:DUF4424 domain-containing protein n=1 Tax=Roseateles aquae TaxID=3077235 RepID=A0ABU3P6V3_9BURK|nr:hypothetical protein [Paucibacter sp. APW11]